MPEGEILFHLRAGSQIRPGPDTQQYLTTSLPQISSGRLTKSSSPHTGSEYCARYITSGLPGTNPGREFSSLMLRIEMSLLDAKLFQTFGPEESREGGHIAEDVCLPWNVSLLRAPVVPPSTVWTNKIAGWVFNESYYNIQRQKGPQLRLDGDGYAGKRSPRLALA